MIDLLIPMEVPSQNTRERQHWSKQRKEVKRWADWLCYLMRPQGLDKATGRRRVQITAYRKALIRDQANLIGGCKGLIDALVCVGLLVDDCDRMAEFTYAQALAKTHPNKRPCTLIIIDDLP